MRIKMTVAAVLLLPVLLGLGLGAILAQPAHAVNGFTGMCDSGANSAYCWRQNGGGTYLWNRDIANDPQQQYAPQYLGSTGQLGCLPPGMPDNVGVWAFYAIDGNPVGAGYQEYLGEDTSGHGAYASGYDQWAWAAGGGLFNCGQSLYWGSFQGLCGYYNNELWHQLRVSGACSEPYTLVDPPARRR